MPAIDYYELDALLGDEERMTRDSVRTFVERECLPVLEQCHSREEFPRHLIPRDMVTEITKGQLLAYRLGQLKDAGRARAQQISLAKRNNVSQALHIARLARDILGANGIVNEYPVIRHMLTGLDAVC